MSQNTKRVRMFAGPNGSGKTTIKKSINSDLFGIYINPDDIELSLKNNRFLDLNSYSVHSSQPDKIEFLQKAQKKGFRTYLYYVATEDPMINILRVKNRVTLGGHSVPEDKIISRYHRSLDLLRDAVQFTNRAYIFDNSGREHLWIAEITNGKELEMKASQMPCWFKKALWDKLVNADNQS